jgi:hypothetical protein
MEEAEIKRLCSLLLARVPHSDDMSDDPLRYIAAQIQEGKPAEPKKVKLISHPPPVQKAEIRTVVKSSLPTSTTSTTISSETSNRDTLTTTDYNTPLTSGGLSPEGNARRFSDATRKSMQSLTKPGSSLRLETSPQKESRNLFNANNLHKSTENATLAQDAEAIKRTLRLVTDGDSYPQSMTRSLDVPRSRQFSAVDLNKNLPPPPLDGEDVGFTSEDSKQPHISRLMKTIRKKKSMPNTDFRSLSTSAPSPATQASFRNKASVHAPPTPISPLRTVEQVPSKKRFLFRMFGKRRRPTNVLIS